jgi:hypothetical protein
LPGPSRSIQIHQARNQSQSSKVSIGRHQDELLENTMLRCFVEKLPEGIESGKVSETCRRYEITPNLFYRWKDEAEQGAKAALGGRSAAAAETEKGRRI